MTHTIATKRQLRAVFKGREYNPDHFHFQRQHDSRLPFPDQIRAARRAKIIDAVIGTVSLVVIIGALALLAGGWV